MYPRVALVCLFASACLGSATAGGISDPKVDGHGMRILFIGNSHTYVNDVPGILQALADSAGGETLAVETFAKADYAVIDHWYAGDASQEIAKGWAYVVLQQGWTPAGVCRDTLRLAAKLFAPGIVKAGGRPALFQTWPPETRPAEYQGTIESYRLAAADVDGLLFPVAEAWQALRTTAPTLQLYADGLHANLTGSYLTALVMYARIFQKTPVGLPRQLRLHSGTLIIVEAGTARLLQETAAKIGLAPTPATEPTAPPIITNRC